MCRICTGDYDQRIIDILLPRIEECDLLQWLAEFDHTTYNSSTDGWYFPSSPIGRIFQNTRHFVGQDTVKLIMRAERLQSNLNFQCN
jgi:hypothetical protein